MGTPAPVARAARALAEAGKRCLCPRPATLAWGAASQRAREGQQRRHCATLRQQGVQGAPLPPLLLTAPPLP